MISGLLTRSNFMMNAVALAFIFNLVLIVESFSINRGRLPSNILRNGSRDTRHAGFGTSSDAGPARLYDTRLQYQRGKINHKNIVSHHYFMEELDRDEVITRATISTHEETESLDTRKLELEMEYRMAELEYLFKRTQLESMDESHDVSSDQNLQLASIVPSQGDSIAKDSNLETELTMAADDDEKQPNMFSFLSEIWIARILVLVSAALYGTNFTMVKLLDETMPVGISTTLRFGIAALATLPWLIMPPTKKENSDQSLEYKADSAVERDMQNNEAKEKNIFLKLRDEPTATALSAAVLGFEVGVWTSIGYVAQAVGLQTTDASKSAFICSLAVVVVPILDFLTGKKLPPRKAAGALMAIAGVGFLEFGGMASELSISSGDLLSLVQPLAFGVGFWRMERAMHKYPTEASRMTASQILAVFVASAAYCVISENTGGADLPNMSQITTWVTDPVILSELFWTGTITTALTVYMETVALKTLSAAETTLLFSTEPLWGAAFAAVVVGERFGFGSAIGALLILGGCIFSNLGPSNAAMADTVPSIPAETSCYDQEGTDFGELLAGATTYFEDATVVADVGATLSDKTVQSTVDIISDMAP